MPNSNLPIVLEVLDPGGPRATQTRVRGLLPKLVDRCFPCAQQKIKNPDGKISLMKPPLLLIPRNNNRLYV
jgi:hypothetical protein